MRKILLSPHNDDAVLFCAFAICEHPDIQVVTVFDSYVQQSNPKLLSDEVVAVGSMERRREDRHAIKELQAQRAPIFAGLRDDVYDYSANAIRAAVDIATGKPDWTEVELWLPMWHKNGHMQHNAVAEAFGNSAPIIHRYTTYSRVAGRVREIPGDKTQGPSIKVVPDPAWIIRKLRALAHYESQIAIKALGNWTWFMDLREYVA